VSTHRRAWKQRAGVVVALVAGALLAIPATPALAAPGITNVSASPSSVEAGKTTKVKFTLTFTDTSPADVSVSSSNPKLACIDGCSRGRVNASGSYEATFRLADDAANGSATITVKATDSNGPLKQQEEGSTNVTLIAKAAPPPQAQTVRSVSGKVTVAANGDAVPNASVMLKDNTGKIFETTSDGSGNFRFTGSTDKPIAPGRIDLGASKDDIRAVTSFNANAGESVTGQRIRLAIKVEVTPSATPAATEEAVPTDEATDQAAEETADAAPGQQAAAKDTSGAVSYTHSDAADD
jgi:hypothetical protein